MASLNEVQRKWLDDFVGLTGRVAGTSELSLDGATKQVMPTDGMAAAMFSDNASGATIGVLAGAAGVLMAGASSGDSNLPGSGSTNASGGSGGSAGSPPGGNGGDDLGPPTYRNVPGEEASVDDSSRIAELVEENGKWRVKPRTGSSGDKRTAHGKYDFVVVNGRILASKADNIGHTELAKGGNAAWAGTIRISNKGVLVDWDNASGHYLPSGSASEVSNNPPPHPSLKWDKFVWKYRGESVTRPDGKKHWPQLPVFQPRPRDADAPHKSPQSVPETSQGGAETPPGPASASQVDEKAAQTFIRGAEENKTLADQIEQSAAKGGAPLDTAKLQKQTIDLENEAEKLAKQLRAHPDLADIPGSNSKEFFKGVKAKFKVPGGAAGVVLLALNVADAYQLVQAVRYIIDSRSLSEAVQKGLQFGGDAAKETAKFALLTRAIGAPAAGVLAYFGDLDEPGRPTAETAFENEIARVVNEIRPDSVRPKQNDTLNHFVDDEAEKLYNRARQQAIDMWKDKLAKPLTKMGLMDGLCEIKTKPMFEVPENEKFILSIDDKWLEQMYDDGLEQGKLKRDAAMKRVVVTGFNDGKAGRPSNFEAVRKWPELQVLIRRYEGNDKTPLSANDLLMCQTKHIEYERQYDLSYKKGYETARR